jgi:hypothetical protein
VKKGVDEKKEQEETKILLALERFTGGYNCAQSVFSAFCDELSIGREKA